MYHYSERHKGFVLFLYFVILIHVHGGICMKKAILALVVLALCNLGGLGAESGESGDSDYAKPVLVKEIAFTASYKDGQVSTSWKKYLRNDFQWYKLVRSQENANPVYPDDGYVFYTEDPGVTTYQDPAPKAGVWYYRLTIVTVKGERWISPVIKVTVPFIASPIPGKSDFAP